MEIIDEKRFEEAKALKPALKDEFVAPKVGPEEMEKLLAEFDNPVRQQKEMAIKLKLFLDNRIKEELDERNTLSDGTRRWIETYNSLMEKLQRAIHGEKSVNLNLTKISHQDIANKIREADNAAIS